MKKLLIVSIFLFLQLSFTQVSEQFSVKELEQLKNKSKVEALSFNDLDELPVFPGCERALKIDQASCFQKKIQMHIAKKMRIPRIANKEKFQRVFVKFAIDIDGTIDSIATRGGHPLVKKEGRRIISLLPKMKPGSKDGKLVKVTYSVPITFQMY